MRIMFLCTGNSCRSQMAEGWARHLARELQGTSSTSQPIEVYSAGLEPAGLNPRAVAAMAEVGIDISQQTSKAIDPQLLSQMDVVVTLCGDAEERCPVTPPSIRRLHWPLPDPARATGSQKEVMDSFRRVRDEIGERVRQLLSSLGFRLNC
ncbi:MAG: arsenate reductase (thioredoxin) [Clostridia bacterium]|nr:arsenate reductase (thioredoxin) [Clostridia bacterium]